MCMRLLVVRHGKALAREKWHKDDPLRPLTKDGAKQASEVFACLRGLLKPQEIWTSPWKRARQTASIAAEAWHLPLREVSWLAGGTMPASQRRYHLPRDRDLAIVGHEPDLGELIGLLIGGEAVPLKKAGVALLEGDPVQSMTLQLLLTPKLVLALSGQD